MGRGSLASLVLAVVSVLALATPAPASADTCEGVWVVVDARAAGGSLTTSCAPGDPVTGLAALEQAGHAYAFVPRIPGMVCTIDARPDPCNGAPADAYWSYWSAEAGGAWAYATVGAGSRDPAPGSVEGWAFGDGTTPPGTPPPASAPEPEPDLPAQPDPPEEAAGEAQDGGGPATEVAPQDTATDQETTETADQDTTTDQDTTGAADVEEPEGDTRADDTEPVDEDERSPSDAGPTGDAMEAGPGSTDRSDETPATSTDRSQTPSPDTAPPDGDAVSAEGENGDQDEAEPILAAQPGPSDPTMPPSALVAIGLLAVIASLTWWQRRRRSQVAA